MKVLITGSAGFIGSNLAMRLLDRGDEVIGIDHDNYTEENVDLEDRDAIAAVFKKHQPQRVMNLAAQAGVRYSLVNPHSYIDTNIVGFCNVLEGCRHNGVEHLAYASSSSVYGLNTSMPFTPHRSVNHPVSLYAASKKANELMAHSYSHLFNLPTTGLRFFTVYGPWGRPDMALFMFTKNILAGEPIDVFNHGKHRRDFTYIDDIVEGVVRVIDNIPQPNPEWDSNDPDPATGNVPYQIYNIGNNNVVELMDYIKTLEDCLGKKAIMNMLPLQNGDVPDTFANVDDLVKNLDYKPNTSVKEGIKNFVDWYKGYYQI